jgi:hypothetical protein
MKSAAEAGPRVWLGRPAWRASVDGRSNALARLPGGHRLGILQQRRRGSNEGFRAC